MSDTNSTVVCEEEDLDYDVPYWLVWFRLLKCNDITMQ
jgi:hypothetical protein